MAGTLEYDTWLYSRDGESIHSVWDVGLADGARMHRYTNAAGEYKSAIYNRYFERQMECPREFEERLVRGWNRTYEEAKG